MNELVCGQLYIYRRIAEDLCVDFFVDLELYSISNYSLSILYSYDCWFDLIGIVNLSPYLLSNSFSPYTLPSGMIRFIQIEKS